MRGRMVELVDALDSKSNGSNTVRVRVSLRPPIKLINLLTQSQYYREKSYLIYYNIHK